MKQWKRLLTVVLVGILALTVLTGCKMNPSDPDTEFENQTVWEAYDKLTNGASDTGCNAGVTYSRKLSNVASKMLDAATKAYGGNEGEYSADRDKAAKEAFEKAVKDGTLPAGSELCVGYLASNPGSFGSFQYDMVYKDSAYQGANMVGIAYNSSNSSLMIVAAYIPSK